MTCFIYDGCHGDKNPNYITGEFTIDAAIDVARAMTKVKSGKGEYVDLVIRFCPDEDSK